MLRAGLTLLIGIKRLCFRANDRRRAAADAEYKAKRPGVIARSTGRCVYCSYSSRQHNQVHHLDDDHHNNDDANLVVACRCCHPYQHVGERSGDIPGEGLGSQTLIVAMPEITAQDLNHLQRAIGAALLDESEAPTARAVLEYLVEERAKPVMDVWETCLPINFAAAMAQLSNQEYANRGDAVGHLRLFFNEDLLQQFGRQLLMDYPALPVKTWEGVAADVGRKIKANA